MTFLELLAHRGIPFRRSASDATRVYLCCPFCTDNHHSADTSFHLGVHFHRWLANCFRCGWKSSHGTQSKILRRIGVPQDLVQDEETPQALRSPTPRLPSDFQLLSSTRKGDTFAQQAYSYLKQRGVTQQQIQRNRIGFSMVGRFAYRIVFPVMVRKKLEGIVARDFTGTSPVRYLNSSGEKSLYNAPSAFRARKVVLSEGIFKALALEQVTDYTSLAVLGHSLTGKQTQQLQDLGVGRVAVWPDPDRVGIHGALEIADALLDMGVAVEMVAPPEQQADEMEAKELQRHWSARRPYDQNLRNRCQNLMLDR